MRTLLLTLFAGLIFACSGGSHHTTPTPPTPPPVKTVAPIPAGIYTAKPRTTGAAEVAYVATPISDVPQTMIVDQFGQSLLALPGWNLVRANINADNTGTLQLGLTPILTDVNGTISPVTSLVGTLVGSEMSGTINGTLTFDLTLTSIESTPIDWPAKAGKWTSTACNINQVLVVTLPSSLSIQGTMLTIQAYSNATDAAAGTNTLGYYQGTLGWNSSGNESLNCLSIGFDWYPAGVQQGTVTYGLAYFDASGRFVMLTSNPTGNVTARDSQLSAIFTKQ